MDYTAIAFTILAAVFWYKGAELENRPALIPVCLSIAVSVLVMMSPGGGWLMVLLGQLALVVIITLYRTFAGDRTRQS